MQKPNRYRKERSHMELVPSKQDRRAVNLRGRRSQPPSRAVRDSQRRQR